MKKYNVLVLTDHINHSKENSLYSLVQTMLQHELTAKIAIASRGNFLYGKGYLSFQELDARYIGRL